MTKTDDEFEKELKKLTDHLSSIPLRIQDCMGYTASKGFAEGANWAKSHFQSKLEEKDNKLAIKLGELDFDVSGCYDFDDLLSHIDTVIDFKTEELKQKLEGYEKVLRDSQCLCSARWSGIDESMYRALGCPSCVCEHKNLINKNKECV